MHDFVDLSYYRILQDGLPGDLTIRRFVHGVAWTAAVLSDGSTGVAMHTSGETVPRMFESLVGLPLHAAGRHCSPGIWKRPAKPLLP